MFVPTQTAPPLARTVALLQAIAICRGLVFVVPVLVPYFATRIGLDFQQFLLTEAIFAASVAVMEVPSGWLADRWQRRRVIALGGIVGAVGFALLIPADGFVLASIAQATMGVGVSLISGADTALLYDALLARGQGDRFRVIEGRRHGFGLYAVGLSSLAGGAMYALNPVLPVLAMVVAYLGVIGCALALSEPARATQPARASGPRGGGPRHALAGLRHHGNGLAVPMAICAVLFAATSVGMWSQQAYYIAIGLPEVSFGVWIAVGFLAGGLAGQLGHHLDRRLGVAGALAVLWLGTALAYAASGLVVGWHGVGLLLAGSVTWGAGWPLLQTLLNRQVSSARRATALSAASLATKLGFVPLSAAIGWLTDLHGVGVGLVGLSLWLLLGGAVVAGLRRRLVPPHIAAAR